MEEREEERKNRGLAFVLSCCPLFVRTGKKTENQACRPKGELAAAPSLVWLPRTPSSSLACLPGAPTGDSSAAHHCRHVLRTLGWVFTLAVRPRRCALWKSDQRDRESTAFSLRTSRLTERDASKKGGRRESSASQYTKAQTFICRLDMRHHGDCFRVFTSGPHCAAWRGKVSTRGQPLRLALPTNTTHRERRPTKEPERVGGKGGGLTTAWV